MRRFADPLLLFLCDRLTVLRISTGRAGGFNYGIVLYRFWDREFIGSLGAAAQIGQREVGQWWFAIVPLGQRVKDPLKVGSAKVCCRLIQKRTPMVFIVFIAVETLLPDAFGCFGSNQVIVQSSKGGFGLGGIHSLAQCCAVSFGSSTRCLCGGTIKAFVFGLTGFIFADADTVAVTAIGTFFICHVYTPPLKKFWVAEGSYWIYNRKAETRRDLQGIP